MSEWEFRYAAVPNAAADDDGQGCDVVVATTRPVDAGVLARALRDVAGDDVAAEMLIARAPLFWTRVRSAHDVRRAAVRSALEAARIAVRYVASAKRGSTALAPRLRWARVLPVSARAWTTREAPPAFADPRTAGRWFLRDEGGGIAVDRARCGLGARTRLAVIDDDVAERDQLDLDAEIPVGIDAPPRATSHGALMVAWATGCHGERGFRGVAPGASTRVYCVPKAGHDVVSLPLAIARASLDGADVIVCATYMEGSSSPMLDDALSIASTLGRRGRGAAVVFPTGREASSPSGSLHSSWTLALGDPACDPRAFCIGPSARDGAWFLWRDRKGRLRPFANRGPALRWLAPGDDIAYPFGDRERLFHAESSGASAIAAGALLLVLASNPSLRLAELDAIVTRTIEPLDPRADAERAPLADSFDVMPRGRDADGHNAKHGYGRIHATRACVAARDPMALTLLAMGEEQAARNLADKLAAAASRPYSPRLARWAVRALLADVSAEHALRAILRHGRLIAGRPDRQRSHGEGALARQIVLFLRALAQSSVRQSHAVARELAGLTTFAEREPAQIEARALDAFGILWATAPLAPLHLAPLPLAPLPLPPLNDTSSRFGSGDVPL